MTLSTVTSKPDSSRTSRLTVTLGRSPISAQPPGNAPLSGFRAFRIQDGVDMFLLVGVGKLLESCFGCRVPVQGFLQVFRDAYLPRKCIFLKFDFHLVANILASLLSDRFQDNENVEGFPHPHQGAPVWLPLNSGFYRDAFFAKYLFHVKRNSDICAAATCIFDGGCVGLDPGHGGYCSML